MNVLVTGANGFVAKALCSELINNSFIVRGTVRDRSLFSMPGVDLYSCGDLSAQTDWRKALNDVEVVCHLASTVHKPEITDPHVYYTTIAAATQTLVEQALRAGVKKFVYLSTSHVYGVESLADLIHESHEKSPLSPYGAAKLAAEQQLLKISQNSNLSVSIVRPPLVYGYGARGNFSNLVKFVNSFACLPFGSANKQRSFVGIDNLIAFLRACIEKPDANGVFNISDDQDLSTRDLCELIAGRLEKKRIFLPIPRSFFKASLRFLKKENLYNKLFESVRLDIGQAKKRLNWSPPFGVEDQIAKALR